MSLLQIAELEGRLQRRDARIAELERALAEQTVLGKNEPVAPSATLHVTELRRANCMDTADVRQALGLQD